MIKTTDSDGTVVTVIPGETVHTVVAVTTITDKHDEGKDDIKVITTTHIKSK